MLGVRSWNSLSDETAGKDPKLLEMGIHQAGAGRYPQGLYDVTGIFSNRNLFAIQGAGDCVTTAEQSHSSGLPHSSEKATKEIAFLPVL